MVRVSLRVWESSAAFRQEDIVVILEECASLPDPLLELGVVWVRPTTTDSALHDVGCARDRYVTLIMLSV